MVEMEKPPELTRNHAIGFSLFAALILFSACAPGSPRRVLADRFNQVAGQGSGGSFERHSAVMRGGLREDAMTLVAPVVVRAGIGALSGRFTLRMMGAPVFNIGDGMQFDVMLKGAGSEQQVFSRYFDAGRKLADRNWAPLAVPLDLKGTADEYIEFRLSGGPQGDLVADWLALAEVRLDPTGR